MNPVCVRLLPELPELEQAVQLEVERTGMSARPALGSVWETGIPSCVKPVF